MIIWAGQHPKTHYAKITVFLHIGEVPYRDMCFIITPELSEIRVDKRYPPSGSIFRIELSEILRASPLF